ncbi:hypothetical protein [Oceanirhabdus seepicola]|uniref:Uncharacterized protein n=1 Tax=Oceanirhabdus seepicola TaxID=2828781 RepID=A0A9J6NY32_9CLOT|nr:hypothetical protein [Oceanirhabdus seepicola]MCM1988541.1 hypothetical protein [Oceanirhabdus seepicola]
MKFFGPNKSDIWRKFAEEINAEFNPSMIITKKFKSYTIELTTINGRNSPVYTTISCTMPNKHNLKFKIIGDYSERYIINYTKLMDYIIENDELKSKYIIRSNSRFIIDQLLDEPDIVKYLVDNRDIFIEYRTTNMMESDNPSENSILKLSILGTVMDNSLLKDLFELSANIITIIDLVNSSVENPLVVKDPNILEVIKSSATNLYENSDKINSLANKFIHKNKGDVPDSANITTVESIPLNKANTHEDIINPTTDKESSDIIQINSMANTDSDEIKLDTSLDSLNMDNLTISTDDLQISTDDLVIPSISTDDYSPDN